MRDGVLGRLVGRLGVDRLGAGLDTGLGAGFGAERVGLDGRDAGRDDRELLDEDAGGDGRLTGAERVTGAGLVTGAGTDGLMDVRGVALGKRGVALPSRGTPDPEETRAKSSRFRIARPMSS